MLLGLLGGLYVVLFADWKLQLILGNFRVDFAALSPADPRRSVRLERVELSESVSPAAGGLHTLHGLFPWLIACESVTARPPVLT